MIETYTERSSRPSRQSSQPPTYLSQADSDDDDNNFQPPALSDYALALLQKERDGMTRMIQDENANQKPPITKRVNFRNSPENHRGIKVHHPDPHTLNTVDSEYETISTKTSEGDSYATTGTGLHEKTQKTPSNRSGGSEVDLSYNGQMRLRSSTRRNRGFGGLGPPKRTSLSVEERIDTSHNEQNIDDTPMKNATPDSKQPAKTSPQEYRTPDKHSNTYLASHHSTSARQKIDFEGLNPYQYSKKHGIQSTELPNLVKIYFEQQKHATKEALNYNSPIRVKEAIQNHIEEQLHHRSAYISEPRKELLQFEKPSQRAPPMVYSDNKENENGISKKLNSSVERPVSVRRPLAALNDPKQLPVTDKPKTLSHQQELRQNEYYERHYKETEPLKAPDESRRMSRLLTINGKQYEKLELMGKGGTSKVFKVKSLSNKVYAVKKIAFDEFDDYSIRGFKGEIDLLLKLRDSNRVVRLVDYALGQGSLSLVMECGDVDLSHVLAKRLDMPMDVEFVRYHANEVLNCVKAVHDAGIVHSDLKPANFLFVKGMLKVIDFGIANAVPDHTVNIYRESQIGTPSYMAPEALIDNNQQLADASQHKSQWKVGKPSDIWSCGCIIYQMIYGRSPYGGYQGSQRLLAIMNPDVKIAYPDKGLGGVKVPGTAIETIQACMRRDPGDRWTAEEVLEGPFLSPRVVSEQFVNDLVKNAITYGVGKSFVDGEELKSLADDVWKRVSKLSL